MSTLEFVLMGHDTACSYFSGTDIDDYIISTLLTPVITKNSQGVPNVFPAKIL